MVSAQAAPWEAAAPHEQLFVLITGANSGIGLGIAQRLIDEFLATRSLSSHLVLVPTTRSPAKSLQTIRTLRSHVVAAAQRTPRTASSWQDAVGRVHVLSPQLDLCDLRGVYAFARRLVEGRVANPEGLEGEYLAGDGVRLPRLDSVIFNAAYGGWSGVDYPLAVWTILTKGWMQPLTWPTFKMALPTCILNERSEYKYPPKPLLGEVFTACVFGHYIVAHELLPLLNRPAAADAVPPGRIIWSSSLEAIQHVFSPDDIQCFRSEGPYEGPYESAKRLTDVLSLTAELPSVQSYSGAFLTPDDDAAREKLPVPAKIYLTHPGIVASTLFPVPWFLMWAYELILVISRYFGSPWHNVDSYTGAKSAAWVAIQEQSVLDDLGAERVKWGSSSNRRLEVDVKKTEVEGWGWEGKPENAQTRAADTATGVFHKNVGRRRGVADVTQEDLVQFEELGAQCWENMERLRHEWEDILGVKKGSLEKETS